MTPNEEWRPVVGHEDSHEVSDQGRLRSIDRTIQTKRGPRRLRGHILPTYPDPYPQAVITINYEVSTLRVHVAVAAAFIGPCPDGLEVCHNDGDRINNQPSNLRYDTHSANGRDVVLHGTHKLANRTHCNHGHEFTPENTYLRVDSPRARRCITCRESGRRR